MGADVRQFEEQKVGFLSLQESIDTNTTSRKLTFHLFGVLAEFESTLIRERTWPDGCACARPKGRLPPSA
jgi:DNA invertase Pin-like site-specific DNA recombinase